MRKTALVIISLCLFLPLIHPQNNDFFKKLQEKDLATFNDGITLMKIIFQEKDLATSFYENILWAAEKKLFKVTIPITRDQINPVLMRREFAYWVCSIYSGKDGLVSDKNITRYTAYKTLVSLGILSEGRGSFDTFTGLELLSAFSYLDHYIKYNKIKPDKTVQAVIEDDEYKYLPEWRLRIYKELEEQRAKEKEKRLKKIEARKNRIKTKSKTEKLEEKKIE